MWTITVIIMAEKEIINKNKMKMVKKLNEKERMIIDKRFFLGKTQMEIANELNISQAQVSRLESSAIKQLKKVLK
mgnify:CR=1 FL=1